MEQQPLSNHEKVPRLGQCYLCRGWYLEKSLSPVEIPDQAGYIRKLACQGCLKPILLEDKPISP